MDDPRNNLNYLYDQASHKIPITHANVKKLSAVQTLLYMRRDVAKKKIRDTIQRFIENQLTVVQAKLEFEVDRICMERDEQISETKVAYQSHISDLARQCMVVDNVLEFGHEVELLKHYDILSENFKQLLSVDCEVDLNQIGVLEFISKDSGNVDTSMFGYIKCSQLNPSQIQIVKSEDTGRAFVGIEELVTVETRSTDIKADSNHFSAYVLSPSGEKCSCLVKVSSDKSFLCKYTPEVAGEYTVHICLYGENVTGSPFKVTVSEMKSESERGDSKDSDFECSSPGKPHKRQKKERRRITDNALSSIGEYIRQNSKISLSRSPTKLSMKTVSPRKKAEFSRFSATPRNSHVIQENLIKYEQSVSSVHKSLSSDDGLLYLKPKCIDNFFYGKEAPRNELCLENSQVAEENPGTCDKKRVSDKNVCKDEMCEEIVTLRTENQKQSQGSEVFPSKPDSKIESLEMDPCGTHQTLSVDMDKADSLLNENRMLHTGQILLSKKESPATTTRTVSPSEKPNTDSTEHDSPDFKTGKSWSPTPHRQISLPCKVMNRSSLPEELWDSVHESFTETKNEQHDADNKMYKNNCTELFDMIPSPDNDNYSNLITKETGKSISPCDASSECGGSYDIDGMSRSIEKSNKTCLDEDQNESGKKSPVLNSSSAGKLTWASSFCTRGVQSQESKAVTCRAQKMDPCENVKETGDSKESERDMNDELIQSKDNCRRCGERELLNPTITDESPLEKEEVQSPLLALEVAESKAENHKSSNSPTPKAQDSPCSHGETEEEWADNTTVSAATNVYVSAVCDDNAVSSVQALAVSNAQSNSRCSSPVLCLPSKHNVLAIHLREHPGKDIKAKEVCCFGRKGYGVTDNLFFPIGVTSTNYWNVIVCDNGNDMVKMYSRYGEHIFTIGSQSGLFSRPSAVAVGCDWKIFVKDSKQIHVFDHSGCHTFSFGKKHLVAPYGLSINKDKLLVVLDHCKKDPSIVLFEQNGKLVKRCRYTPIIGTSKSKCRFLTTYEDKLIVTDLGLNKVYVTDFEGNLIHKFGALGRKSGEFMEPSGVTVDSQGNLLIADSKNNRIQVFQMDGTYLCQVKLSSDSNPVRRPSDIHLTSNGHLIIVNFIESYVHTFRLEC